MIKKSPSTGNFFDSAALKVFVARIWIRAKKAIESVYTFLIGHSCSCSEPRNGGVHFSMLVSHGQHGDPDEFYMGGFPPNG